MKILEWACKITTWNWERLIFVAVGLALLSGSLLQARRNDMPSSAALFSMAFFSFFYSNISRFKRFKGLGFEAELWEEKQEEADALIVRLKALMQLVAKETITNKISSGRFIDHTDWVGVWSLFDQLTGGRGKPVFDEDFADIKLDMDQRFLADITSTVASRIFGKKVSEAKRLTHSYRKNAVDQYGNGSPEVVQNSERFNAISDTLVGVGQADNPAQVAVEWLDRTEVQLKDWFEVELPKDDDFAMARSDLAYLARSFDKGPLEINDRVRQIHDRYFS